MYLVSRRAAALAMLLTLSSAVGGCDDLSNLLSGGKSRIQGRWRDNDGVVWEFLSDGSVTTSSAFATSGRWALLDDGRYSITLNIMLRGDTTFIGHFEGDDLHVQLGNSRTVLRRIE